jgi:hypothetical protein
VRFGAAFGQDVHVVAITSSRRVSALEPTLGSGSGVRRWGRSRPGCSPALVISAAKDAARSASEAHATILRKPNALQEKSSEQTLAVVTLKRPLSVRIGEHACGEMGALGPPPPPPPPPDVPDEEDWRCRRPG